MAVKGTKREYQGRSESGTYAGSAAVMYPKDTPELTSEPFCTSWIRGAPVTVRRFALHESNLLRPRQG